MGSTVSSSLESHPRRRYTITPVLELGNETGKQLSKPDFVKILGVGPGSYLADSSMDRTRDPMTPNCDG